MEGEKQELRDLVTQLRASNEWVSQEQLCPLPLCHIWPHDGEAGVCTSGSKVPCLEDDQVSV